MRRTSGAERESNRELLGSASRCGRAGDSTTFAQTISSTRPTAPHSTSNGRRMLPLTCSWSRVSRAPNAEQSRVSAVLIAAASDVELGLRGAPVDTPGFNRRNRRECVAPRPHVFEDRRPEEVDARAGREDRREVERRGKHAGHERRPLVDRDVACRRLPGPRRIVAPSSRG